MEKIKLYSKESCVQCTATERALNMEGVEYEKIDLMGDEAALDRFISEGHTQAPIVDTGSEVWSGFRPDRIKAVARLAMRDVEEP